MGKVKNDDIRIEQGVFAVEIDIKQLHGRDYSEGVFVSVEGEALEGVNSPKDGEVEFSINKKERH